MAGPKQPLRANVVMRRQGDNSEVPWSLRTNSYLPAMTRLTWLRRCGTSKLGEP